MLATGPYFVGVPEEQLARLASSCELRRVARGEILLRAGAQQRFAVYLAEGTVSLYRRNRARGAGLLLSLFDAPAIFGDTECMTETAWAVSVRVERAAVCLIIPDDVFRRLVREQTGLALRLYQDACHRQLVVSHTAQTVALYGVETRLLLLLLEYAYRFGSREGDSARIGRRMSYANLASALGVASKTVARAMRSLRDQGLVSRQTSDDSFVVHRLSELQHMLPKDVLGPSWRSGERARPALERWRERRP